MNTSLASQLRPALVALVLLTLITGVAYPLLVTGIVQVAFPWQADGSIIRDARGQARGSALIGQPFDDPRYFWGRLSATGTFAYNSFNAENLTASSGSNLGPLNPALIDVAQARIDALRAADPQASGPVPVDLVTASGSGLDPHISPAAAEFQVRRVAQARGMPEDQVRALVARYTEGRDLGVLGEPRVNVLRLNLALDGITTH
ncbi:MAG TPA: potassium-transporting ATPase subunit KdpC [Roseiflexaceae bacterium]|nr:potassium-transporting ATPase subunit KdpC [Roseiflexaceae bacterium]